MIKVVTDTTAGLDLDWVRQHHVPYIPQVIYFGEQSFLEIEEISQAEFLRRLKASSSLPRTAAPPPGLFIKAFQELEADKNTILCIHPSAEVSGTVRSAQLAKEEAFPNADIRIIDTRTIGAQLRLMVMKAVEWAEAGVDADTIVARLADMTRRTRTYFMVATLEYLQRGGRIGGAAAIVGQLLQIKPILMLRDGRVEALARERTLKRATQRLCELVLEEVGCDMSPCVQVMHAEAPERAQELAGYFKERLGRQDVEVIDLVPAIITHAGPGVVGAGFLAKA